MQMDRESLWEQVFRDPSVGSVGGVVPGLIQHQVVFSSVVGHLDGSRERRPGVPALE